MATTTPYVVALKLTQADKAEVEALVDVTPRATNHAVLVAAHRIGMAVLQADPARLRELIRAAPMGRRGRPLQPADEAERP